jgi:aerobic-type carbon monoxide dehydrogenase small subunit (CoxS/CutS family)
MNLWVNGVRRKVDVAAGEMLSDVLRLKLRLTGTKIGCTSQCGSAVLLTGIRCWLARCRL